MRHINFVIGSVHHRVCVDRHLKIVTFQSEHENGQTHFFSLSKYQFQALNDTMLLMDKCPMKGSFPLGKYMWLSYHYPCVTLLRASNGGCYTFPNFNYYKAHIHPRVVSFLRRDANGRDAKRMRNGEDGEDGDEARSKSAGGDRESSLPNAEQSSNRFGTPSYEIEGQQMFSGSTEDGVMLCDEGEASTAFLSERHDSAPRAETEYGHCGGAVCENMSTPQYSEYSSYSCDSDYPYH